MLMQRYNHYSKQQIILSQKNNRASHICDPSDSLSFLRPVVANGVYPRTSYLAPRTSKLPSYPRTHTPMQLVVPSVVRIAVMMLARICKTVFQPSFFIAFSIFNG